MLDVKHINIEDADVKQLRWFAEVAMQIPELKGTENSATLRSRIKDVWSKDEIFLPQKAEEYPDRADSTGRGRRSEKMEFPEGSGKYRECCRINIPAQDPKLVPGGDEDVKVGVNGTAMLIPRGKTVVIPVEFAEVLENAEQFIYAEYNPDTDPLGGLREPKIVKSYPFTYV